MFWRTSALMVLFVPLASCSTYDRMFTDVAPQPAQSVGRDSPVEAECARIAKERADDAAMALYVSSGSPEQRDIYQSTYRTCMDWHGL